jgi:circadian clock protein KaiC
MTTAAAKDPRISTGIPGLDQVLGGGIPPNHAYLIEGVPGTGKTTMALQFLLEGARAGEKGLYVTLSETKVEITQVAASHGWSLDNIELYELEAIQENLQPDEQYTFFHPSEVELAETTKRICQRVEAIRPSRVVFDSLSEMRLLARDPLRYRRQILILKQFFSGKDCTVWMLDDQTAHDTDSQLRSISHGVILLENQVTNHGSSPRRLRVVKMRAVSFQEGYHDFTIERGGLVVHPRLIAALERGKIAPASSKTKTAQSGVQAFDALTGGGLFYGSSTLILGPAGSGKSSIASQFLWTAAERGERVAAYLFEEGRESYLRRSAGMGLDLEKHVSSGRINLHQIDPAVLTPGEFAARVRDEVKNCCATILVIDSLNGYLNAMPSENYLMIQMHELLTYLNDHGVLTLLILAQHGFLGSMQAPMDVSYLADTVVALRYFEAGGRVRKAISVLKKRAGAHENTIREYMITKEGIRIGDPLEEFRGVLTGVPAFMGKETALLQAEERKKS